ASFPIVFHTPLNAGRCIPSSGRDSADRCIGSEACAPVRPKICDLHLPPDLTGPFVSPVHPHRIPRMREMKLQDLKSKTPTELLSFAEELEVENASTMRKQELMFAILKQLAGREIDIIGEGVVEVLSDGFGFLRSPEANYLPGPDDIYGSPCQIPRFRL